MAVNREMKSMDEDLRKAEELVEELKAKRARLEDEKRGLSSRQDYVSSAVIEKMFK